MKVQRVTYCKGYYAIGITFGYSTLDFAFLNHIQIDLIKVGIIIWL